MTDLLEVGQIGILQDYPAELIQVESKLFQSQKVNAQLSTEYGRLIEFLFIAGAVVAIGFLIASIKKQQKELEEQE